VVAVLIKPMIWGRGRVQPYSKKDVCREVSRSNCSEAGIWVDYFSAATEQAAFAGAK